MKIKDLCSYAPKSRIKAGEAVDNAKYLFFTSSADENKRYTDFQFDKEAIIMGTGGNATLHYHNGKFSVSTDCLVLLPDPQIKCKYLYYFFKSHMNVLEAGFKGAGLKHTNKKYIEDIEINKVPDLITQDRIISRLDKISENIEKLNRELGLFDSLVKARFVELTESTETMTTRMGDIATYINGYAFKPNQWEEHGYPIIRIQNLNDRTASYNYFSGMLPEKYIVHNGEVLVSWATHLEAYIWNGNDSWLNQHIFKVIFDKININKTYFVYACDEALKQAFKNAHGFKPTMEHIKKSDFDGAIVKLPDLKTQNQFADFVQQVDKSKLAVQKSLEKTQQLFDSLMQEYFG